MARKKQERPEWFKFWRRNRQQLDIDLLSMESRGIIFTNSLRYFDTGDSELIEMNPIETFAFNLIKANIDEAFSDWEETSRQNSENQKKRWSKEKNTGVYDGIPPCTNDTEERVQNTEVGSENTEARRQRQEDRGQNTEARRKSSLSSTTRERENGFIPPTVEQVKQYCIENEIWIDPQRFIDHNSASNWMRGKTPITDWQALARSWASQEALPERQKLHLTGRFE